MRSERLGERSQQVRLFPLFVAIAVGLTACAGGGEDPSAPDRDTIELDSNGDFSGADNLEQGFDAPALPEPEFVDLAEIYDPWVNDALLTETREWAEQADVEELLPYLDDVVLFALPEHILRETGGGIAWYASANEYFWFDGEPNAESMDNSSPCLPPSALADFYTGGVAHMVLPPDAGPLMLLHELAHHHKHSTDHYDEITRLFGAASYDSDCNVIVTTGEFDEFFPDEWPVTETFEYSFNDYAATNFYGGEYSLPQEVIDYFEVVFSTD